MVVGLPRSTTRMLTSAQVSGVTLGSVLCAVKIRPHAARRTSLAAVPRSAPHTPLGRQTKAGTDRPKLDSPSRQEARNYGWVTVNV